EERLMAALGTPPSAASSARVQILRQLREWLGHGFIFRHLLFACSFTSEGNLLSQWRAYCPPSGGVSLGFNPERLEAVAKEQGFYFAECVYEPQDQLQRMDAILGQVLETAEEKWEAPASQ